MTYKRRGAVTGSGFQEAINRVNDAYERTGRACITRKAIPGKYLVDKGEQRKGLSLPDLGTGGTSRIDSSDLARLAKAQKVTDWRRFVPESKAEPDYGGVVSPDGRAIFFDAKTTRREALDFDNLHAHQISYLERTSRLGAIAGFLVEFNKYKQIFFLPVQVLLKWREVSTRKSLPYKFFTSHLVPAPSGKGLIIFDYLSAIEQQEDRYQRDFQKFDLNTAR